MSAAPRRIDARGLLCPWPALRLARAAREMAGTGDVLVLADDPLARGELQKLCDERGWHCRRDGEATFHVRFDWAFRGAQSRPPSTPPLPF